MANSGSMWFGAFIHLILFVLLVVGIAMLAVAWERGGFEAHPTPLTQAQQDARNMAWWSIIILVIYLILSLYEYGWRDPVMRMSHMHHHRGSPLKY